jgi:hypothetical protein
MIFYSDSEFIVAIRMCIKTLSKLHPYTYTHSLTNETTILLELIMTVGKSLIVRSNIALSASFPFPLYLQTKLLLLGIGVCWQLIGIICVC